MIPLTASALKTLLDDHDVPFEDNMSREVLQALWDAYLETKQLEASVLAEGQIAGIHEDNENVPALDGPAFPTNPPLMPIAAAPAPLTEIKFNMSKRAMIVNEDSTGAEVFIQKFNQGGVSGHGFITFATEHTADFATILGLAGLVSLLAAEYLPGITPLNTHLASGKTGPEFVLARNHFAKIVLTAGMATKIAMKGEGAKDQYPYAMTTFTPFEELEPQQVARAGLFHAFLAMAIGDDAHKYDWMSLKRIVELTLESRWTPEQKAAMVAAHYEREKERKSGARSSSRSSEDETDAAKDEAEMIADANDVADASLFSVFRSNMATKPSSSSSSSSSKKSSKPSSSSSSSSKMTSKLSSSSSSSSKTKKSPKASPTMQGAGSQTLSSMWAPRAVPVLTSIPSSSSSLPSSSTILGGSAQSTSHSALYLDADVEEVAPEPKEGNSRKRARDLELEDEVEVEVEAVAEAAVEALAVEADDDDDDIRPLKMRKIDKNNTK